MQSNKVYTQAQINNDLEAAYEAGFTAAANMVNWRGICEDDIETQEYVDQRRSDLKELKSFDRSL